MEKLIMLWMEVNDMDDYLLDIINFTDYPKIFDINNISDNIKDELRKAVLRYTNEYTEDDHVDFITDKLKQMVKSESTPSQDEINELAKLIYDNEVNKVKYSLERYNFNIS